VYAGVAKPEQIDKRRDFENELSVKVLRKGIFERNPTGSPGREDGPCVGVFEEILFFQKNQGILPQHQSSGSIAGISNTSPTRNPSSFFRNNRLKLVSNHKNINH
jgi:hypothetical protein